MIHLFITHSWCKTYQFVYILSVYVWYLKTVTLFTFVLLLLHFIDEFYFFLLEINARRKQYMFNQTVLKTIVMQFVIFQ
jgi:hypothetical protein